MIFKLNNLTENNIKNISKNTGDIGEIRVNFSQLTKTVDSNTTAIDDIHDNLSKRQLIDDETKIFKEKTEAKLKKRKKLVEDNAEFNYQKFNDIESNIERIFKVLNDTLANNNIPRMTIVTTVQPKVVTSSNRGDRRDSFSINSNVDKKDLDTLKKEILELKLKIENYNVYNFETMKEDIFSLIEDREREKEKEKERIELERIEHESNDKTQKIDSSVKTINGNGNSNGSNVNTIKKESNDELNKNISNFDAISGNDLESLKNLIQKQIIENHKKISSVLELKMDKNEYENTKNNMNDNILNLVHSYTLLIYFNITIEKISK